MFHPSRNVACFAAWTQGTGEKVFCFFFSKKKTFFLLTSSKIVFFETNPGGTLGSAPPRLCGPPVQLNRSVITAVVASQAWFRQGRPNPASSDFSSEKWV